VANRREPVAERLRLPPIARQRPPLVGVVRVEDLAGFGVPPTSTFQQRRPAYCSRSTSFRPPLAARWAALIARLSLTLACGRYCLPSSSREGAFDPFEPFEPEATPVPPAASAATAARAAALFPRGMRMPSPFVVAVMHGDRMERALR
jgi:hypothetical protein